MLTYADYQIGAKRSLYGEATVVTPKYDLRLKNMSGTVRVPDYIIQWYGRWIKATMVIDGEHEIMLNGVVDITRPDIITIGSVPIHTLFSQAEVGKSYTLEVEVIEPPDNAPVISFPTHKITYFERDSRIAISSFVDQREWSPGSSVAYDGLDRDILIAFGADVDDDYRMPIDGIGTFASFAGLNHLNMGVWKRNNTVVMDFIHRRRGAVAGAISWMSVGSIKCTLHECSFTETSDENTFAVTHRITLHSPEPMWARRMLSVLAVPGLSRPIDTSPGDSFFVFKWPA